MRVEAHDHKRVEQLCRYITRPTLSDERVQLNAADQVKLKLKTAWRDGITHLVMSPLEFKQRHIDGRLCRIEFCNRYVSSGSAGVPRVRKLYFCIRSIAVMQPCVSMPALGRILPLKRGCTAFP